MRFSIYILFFLLFFSLCSAQNKLEIRILNDTIKKVSYYDENNIVYKVINNSDRTYCLILDSGEFNEDPDYLVDPNFLGLPDYYLYDKDSILIPEGSFGTHSKNKIFEINESSNDFVKFKKKYSEFFDNNEMKIAYRISKKIVILKPKDEKLFSTKVNFPYYKSRVFNLINKEQYYFQIGIQAPSKMISKYSKMIKKVDAEDLNFFEGTIFSNKVPLVYSVYHRE